MEKKVKISFLAISFRAYILLNKYRIIKTIWKDII